MTQTTAPQFDIDKVSDILRECAAKYILPRFKALQDNEVNTKTGASDLVTIADIEAEDALDRILPDLVPGSYLIGEESISRGDKDITSFTEHDGLVWVVDPVDGTYNFVHGKEEFAVMLACVYKGETIRGWIYDIPKDRMMFAEKGAGTVINGEVQTLDTNAHKLPSTKGYAGRKYFPKFLKPHVDRLSNEIDELSSLSCAGHEYLRLVTCNRDFSIYSRTRAWDHLAGTLCYKEAGGVSLKWDKSPYVPGNELEGIINARNEDLWDELYTHTIEHMINDYKTKTAS